MTIGKYDGYRLYLISWMDRYSVYSTYTREDITTHYSAAEIKELADAVDILAKPNLLKNPPLTLVRAVAQK